MNPNDRIPSHIYQDPVHGWLQRTSAIRVLDRGTTWDIEQAWEDAQGNAVWRKVPMVKDYEAKEGVAFND